MQGYGTSKKGCVREYNTRWQLPWNMNPGLSMFACEKNIHSIRVSPQYGSMKSLPYIFGPEYLEVKFGKAPKFSQQLYAEPAN